MCRSGNLYNLGMKKYIVTLTNDERLTLDKLISAGKGAARRIAHARILLKADQGLTDEAIAEAVEVSRPTVERVRKRFVEEGLDAHSIRGSRKNPGNANSMGTWRPNSLLWLAAPRRLAGFVGL